MQCRSCLIRARLASRQLLWRLPPSIMVPQPTSPADLSAVSVSERPTLWVNSPPLRCDLMMSAVTRARPGCRSTSVRVSAWTAEGRRVEIGRRGSAGIPGLRVGAGPRGSYMRVGAAGIYYQATVGGRRGQRTRVGPVAQLAGCRVQLGESWGWFGVRSYARKDGTRVRSHTRSAPGSGGIGTLIVTVLILWRLAPSGGDTPSESPDPAAATEQTRGDYRFSVLRGSDEPPCSGHAFGQVQVFLTQKPCAALHRVLRARDSGGSSRP